MIRVQIDGREISAEEICKWEQQKVEKMLKFLQKRIVGEQNIKNADEFAEWKTGIPEEQMRRILKRLNGVCSFATGIAVGVSNGKRKISITEIDVDFCDAKTLYDVFLETMLNNTEKNIRCNLRANPEHFLLKGIDEHTQEIIEISGGIPFPERFFIRYGDENGLVSKKEEDYPLQASGVAFLANGKKIGGVRHQMKNTTRGCHIKLMVEFPAAMPDANINAHKYHLACEFYNWFSAFERRLANG